MGVAKELGYTLTRLSEATEEEIILGALFGYLNEEHKPAKARRKEAAAKLERRFSGSLWHSKAKSTSALG